MDRRISTVNSPCGKIFSLKIFYTGLLYSHNKFYHSTEQFIVGIDILLYSHNKFLKNRTIYCGNRILIKYQILFLKRRELN